MTKKQKLELTWIGKDEELKLEPRILIIIERLKGLKIFEPLGDADYGQKYVYADYYEIFDDAFHDARMKEK